MGTYYRDEDHLFEMYGYFLDRVLKDDETTARVARAGIVIKLIYADPDCEITIDLKNPPAKPLLPRGYPKTSACSPNLQPVEGVLG